MADPEPDVATRPDALRELYLAEYQRLVGLARLLVRDAGDAEDVVQDVFARTWARRRHVRDDPLAYVHRAVVNQSRSRLRRHRTAAAHRPEPPAHVESAETGALRAGDSRALVDSVRRLPQRQRECVVLRFYADLTVPQIASRLGLAEGSVKSHLHRAMAALAQDLESHR